MGRHLGLDLTRRQRSPRPRPQQGKRSPPRKNPVERPGGAAHLEPSSSHASPRHVSGAGWEKVRGGYRQEISDINLQDEGQRNERLQARIRRRARVGLSFFQLLIGEGGQPCGVGDAFLSHPRAEARALKICPEAPRIVPPGVMRATCYHRTRLPKSHVNIARQCGTLAVRYGALSLIACARVPAGMPERSQCPRENVPRELTAQLGHDTSRQFRARGRLRQRQVSRHVTENAHDGHVDLGAHRFGAQTLGARTRSIRTIVHLDPSPHPDPCIPRIHGPD